MPVQHAIWQVGAQPTLLAASKLVSEQQLEDMIVSEPRILSSEWMLIGHQEVTSHGGRIDLLAKTSCHAKHRCVEANLQAKMRLLRVPCQGARSPATTP